MDSATVSFSQGSFTVQPGQTQAITATFSLPEGVDASIYPLFSGFIEITSDSESLHVTYIGLGASLKDKQVVDNTDFFFGVPLPALLDSTGNLQIDPTNYTFVDGDVPSVLFRWVRRFTHPLYPSDTVLA